MSGRFAALMVGYDTPMVIVTVAAGDERSGCLVGFATQCSIDPPRFFACISVANHTATVAAHAHVLAVHLVPPDATDLAELFGGETGDEVDKFAAVAWEAGPGGVPLLLALPDRFAGAVLARHDLGDHVGYVLDPMRVDLGRPAGGATTLRYHDVADMQPGHDA